MAVLSRFGRAYTGLSQCCEGTSSYMSLRWCSVWASLQSSQTNPFRIPQNPPFGEVKLGTWLGFRFLWHVWDVELVKPSSSWKCVMSTCKVWKEQNLIWPYNSSMKGFRQAFDHLELWCQLPHRHPDMVTWSSKKPPPGRNRELDNFSSTFWLPFKPFSTL